MGMIGDFIKGRKEKNKQEGEYEDHDRMVSNVERKKLSHNEREMMAVLKKEREENLKKALDFHEKERKLNDIWREREMMRSNVHLLE